MDKKLEEWINELLKKEIPNEVIAFCFNLYETNNATWEMELVGTDTFDLEDEDWACDEVCDFGSRDKVFKWKMERDWEEVLEYMVSELKEYLENGKYAEKLKSSAGVGVGFHDGDLEIIHHK